MGGRGWTALAGQTSSLCGRRLLNPPQVAKDGPALSPSSRVLGVMGGSDDARCGRPTASSPRQPGSSTSTTAASPQAPATKSARTYWHKDAGCPLSSSLNRPFKIPFFKKKASKNPAPCRDKESVVTALHPNFPTSPAPGGLGGQGVFRFNRSLCFPVHLPPVCKARVSHPPSSRCGVLCLCLLSTPIFDRDLGHGYLVMTGRSLPPEPRDLHRLAPRKGRRGAHHGFRLDVIILAPFFKKNIAR